MRLLCFTLVASCAAALSFPARADDWPSARPDSWDDVSPKVSPAELQVPSPSHRKRERVKKGTVLTVVGACVTLSGFGLIAGTLYDMAHLPPLSFGDQILAAGGDSLLAAFVGGPIATTGLVLTGYGIDSFSRAAKITNAASEPTLNVGAGSLFLTVPF